MQANAGKLQAATLEQQGLTARVWRVLGVWRVLKALRVWRLANGRLERPNNRGPCRQTQANGRLQRWNSKGLRLVEAAARDLEGLRGLKGFKGFKGLKAGKRQAWTPRRSHWSGLGAPFEACKGWQTAGLDEKKKLVIWPWGKGSACGVWRAKQFCKVLKVWSA